MKSESQKLDQLKKEQRELFLNKPSSTSPEYIDHMEKIYALEDKITILERKMSANTKELKQGNKKIITLTVTVQKNFTFTTEGIRQTYPELDEQGIEDDEIVDWLMENYQGDILEPGDNNGDIYDYYIDSNVDDYWSTSEIWEENYED